MTTLRFRGNFHFSFSMSLLHTSSSFLCLQETLIFLTSLAVEWFPPAFDCQSSPKINQRVTVFSFTFYPPLRPQTFGSCLNSSMDDDLPKAPGIMSLRHFLTFLPAIGYSHDSQHRWPGLSWNSPSLACVALLSHSHHAARPWSLVLHPALTSRHDLCSSFLPRLPQIPAESTLLTIWWTFLHRYPSALSNPNDQSLNLQMSSPSWFMYRLAYIKVFCSF